MLSTRAFQALTTGLGDPNAAKEIASAISSRATLTTHAFQVLLGSLCDPTVAREIAVAIRSGATLTTRPSSPPGRAQRSDGRQGDRGGVGVLGPGAELALVQGEGAGRVAHDHG